MSVRMVYANHNTDRGKFCAWSLAKAPADSKTDDLCPDKCSKAWVMEDPQPATDGQYLRGVEADLTKLDEVCEVCGKPAAEGEEVQIEEAGRTFGSNPGPIVTCSPACSDEAVRQNTETGLPLSAEIAYLEWQFQERVITTRMGWMSEVMSLLATWREAGRV